MTKRWYIVHAYSNFEKKVADSIKERAAAAGLEEKFEQVLVPMEEVVEVRRGRKVNAERKFFPGYVLVKMDLSDETYHLIKETQGAGYAYRRRALEKYANFAAQGRDFPLSGFRGRHDDASQAVGYSQDVWINVGFWAMIIMAVLAALAHRFNPRQ